jgi:hypothetical protein
MYVQKSLLDYLNPLRWTKLRGQFFAGSAENCRNLSLCLDTNCRWRRGEDFQDGVTRIYSGWLSGKATVHRSEVSLSDGASSGGIDNSFVDQQNGNVVPDRIHTFAFGALKALSGVFQSKRLLAKGAN